MSEKIAMFDYQKKRLENFLELITVEEGQKMLFVTLPANGLPEAVRREQAFLEIAKPYFSLKKIVMEEIQIDALQSMWDEPSYDCIIMRYSLAAQRGRPMDEGKTLSLLHRHLEPSGRIYVLENNLLGLRSLAGDRFDGTGKADGFLRSELLRACAVAGLHGTFYYPHPFAEEMEFLFSDSRLPSDENLETSVEEGSFRLSFFDEKAAFANICKEKIFPCHANQFLFVLSKSRENEPLVFRKYSVRRDERFEISTSMIRSSSGEITVKKSPVNTRAREHIKGIVKSYALLSEQYKGYTLQINRATLTGHEVTLEYTEGTSLELLLDRTLEKEDYESFFGLIQRMSDVVSAPLRISALSGEKKRHPFSGDRGFKRMFGELSFAEEKLLADELVQDVSDIDVIFSNFLINDNSWTLLDYEWTCDFPVPFGFIMFRAIDFYFAAKSGRNHGGSLRAETLERFGITSEKEEIFKRMDSCFHEYVSGGGETYRSVLDRALDNGDFVPLSRVGERLSDRSVPLALPCESYYDFGSGMSMETMVPVAPRIDGDIMSVSIPVSREALLIRFDPGECSGVLRLYSVTNPSGRKLKTKTLSNADHRKKNIYYFGTTDPWLLWDVGSISCEEIVLRYSFIPFPADMQPEMEALLSVLNDEKKSILPWRR